MRDAAFRVGAFVLMSLLVLAWSRAPANSLELLGLNEPAGLIAYLSPLFLNQYLPFFDEYARSHRLWSPASDALVVPVLEAGRSVLTVYGLDGSVRTLGPGDMPVWNVR